MSIESKDFLGQGWSFPPTFSQGGAELEMVTGAADIQQSLHILLSTHLGERIMQEDFGCDLQAAVFETINQHLINIITQQVSDAIIYHEPRIKLEQVEVNSDNSEAGLLTISIVYTIRSTNSRFNLVYPFYLYETHLGAGLEV